MAATRDREVARIESHYDKFAETFQALDLSKDELVSAFEHSRKRQPGLSADAYLNVGVRKFADAFRTGTQGLVKPSAKPSTTTSRRREDLLASLARHGIDPVQITSAVPDTLLAELVRVLDSLKNGAVKHSETRKVEQHFERFAEQFESIGTTRAELVSAFEARRRRNPALTAEAYLSGR